MRAEGSVRAPTLHRLGWEIEALSTVLTGAPNLAFEDLPVHSTLDAVATSLHEAGLQVRVVASGDGAVWADGEALDAAVRQLALEAEDAGSRRVDLAASETDSDVEIVVAYDGAPLSPAVSALVFDRANDDERSAVEAGAAPLRLLAALDLIEAMGGTLVYRTGSGGPEYAITLPRAGVLRVVPAAGTLPAPAVTVPA